MEDSRFDRVLDYFPLLAYFGFWVQGAFLGALLTGDPHLVWLGLVTTPAIAALLVAAHRIRRNHRERRSGVPAGPAAGGCG